MNNQLVEIVRKRNEVFLKKLHPSFVPIFNQWFELSLLQEILIEIFSGTRSNRQQTILYNNWLAGKSPYPAAEPGKSYHEYSLAVDVKIANKEDPRDLESHKIISKIAKALGIDWGGDFTAKKYSGYKERHHYQYTNGYNWKELKQLRESNSLDSNGFVVLDNDKVEKFKVKKNSIQYSIGQDIDQPLFVETTESTTDNKQQVDKPKFIKQTVEIEATGIWQIIKVVIDKEIADYVVNDSTIAFNQGSLFTFIQKVCQRPFVEFYGDTYGNKYYFIVRKPPFTRQAFLSLFERNVRINVKNPNNTITQVEEEVETSVNIFEQDVIADSLEWNNEEIYSWYQLIDQGNYFTDNASDILAQVPAVFFEEYAEIWGSKPLSIQCNYYRSVKDTKLQKGVRDKSISLLKFLTQIYSYLPFTRKGTITIKIDRRIHKGMGIRYNPTGELFYVDAVSHNFTTSEMGSEATTTIQVSRGMNEQYAKNEIKDNNSISYFNLILYGDEQTKTENVTTQKDLKIKMDFYFDNDRSYLIDMSEDVIANDTADGKMKTLITENPSFRNQKSIQNNKNINDIVISLNNNKNMNIEITGFIDADASVNNSKLPLRRADNVKSRIVSLYRSKFPNDTTISSRIIIKSQSNTPSDDNTSISKALNRKATLVSLPFQVIEKKEVKNTNGLQWRVNRPVFQFFLNRKQSNDIVQLDDTDQLNSSFKRDLTING